MLKRCYEGSRCRWKHPEPNERKRLWDDHTARQEEDERLRGIPKLVNPNPKKYDGGGKKDRKATPPWSRPGSRDGEAYEGGRMSPVDRRMGTDRGDDHRGGSYGPNRVSPRMSLSPRRYPERRDYEQNDDGGSYGPLGAPPPPALPPRWCIDGWYEQVSHGGPPAARRAPPPPWRDHPFTRTDSSATSPIHGGETSRAPEVSMLDVPPSPWKDTDEEPATKHYFNANCVPLGKANRLWNDDDDEEIAGIWTGEKLKKRAETRKNVGEILSSDMPNGEPITLWKRSDAGFDNQMNMNDGTHESTNDSNHEKIGGYWDRWRDQQRRLDKAEEDKKKQEADDVGGEVVDMKPEQTMSRDISDLTHARPQATQISAALLPPPSTTTSLKPKMGATKRLSNGETKHVGPHPSTIRVSAPYCSHEALSKQLKRATENTSFDVQERSIAAAREDTVRLQGCTWIDNVRRALQLPIRTYTTACVYYHRFRLAHPGSLNGLEYGGSAWADACAASLLTACKVEDTLKKSRDVLAAAYNLKASAHDQLGSDDAVFEAQSRAVIGLERLVLEAGGFDFRSRYPHRLLVKIAKTMPEGEDDERKKVAQIAWTILTDLHRTFAPLKQTSATLALASLELAAHLVAGGPDKPSVIRDALQQYDIKAWSTSRDEVMETLQDLLELYNDHQSNTILGTKYSIDDFVRIRLACNKESREKFLDRYTKAHPQPDQSGQANGSSTLRVANGHPTPVSPGDTQQPGGAQQQGAANGTQQDNGVGTLRFMLNPQLASDEKAEVQKFFVEEWEEYEEEIEVPIPRTDRSRDRGPPPPGPPRGDRDGVRGGKPDERERPRLRERERDGRRFEERRYEERDRRFERRYDERRYEDDRRGKGR